MACAHFDCCPNGFYCVNGKKIQCCTLSINPLSFWWNIFDIYKNKFFDMLLRFIDVFFDNNWIFHSKTDRTLKWEVYFFSIFRKFTWCNQFLYCMPACYACQFDSIKHFMCPFFSHCHNKVIKINSSILTYLPPVIELTVIEFSGPSKNVFVATFQCVANFMVLLYSSNNNNIKSVRAHAKKCIQSKFYRNTMNFKFMCIIVCFHFHRNQKNKLPWSMNAISVVKI